MISTCPARCRSANVPGMSPPIRRCISHIRSKNSSQKWVSRTISFWPSRVKYSRLGASAPEIVVVERKFLLEFRRGELFRQHRGEIEGPLGRDAVGDEAMRCLQQRQVALEGGLAEPVAAMGPAAVIDHHRKMGMKYEGER